MNNVEKYNLYEYVKMFEKDYDVLLSYCEFSRWTLIIRSLFV